MPLPSGVMLVFSGARQESLQGWRIDRSRSDLVVGSGNYEVAHQESGRRPRPPTRSFGFSSFRNYGSEESKLLVATHNVAYMPTCPVPEDCVQSVFSS